MGMSSNSNNSNRKVMAEINVTPFVDVMLVLLVIFMVTAPMMQEGVQVNLPKAETKAMASQEETIVVSIDKNGSIFINKERLNGSLRVKLVEMFASRDKKEVFLKADAGVPYGEVVRVMADIKASGVERLGMVTEPKK